MKKRMVALLAGAILTIATSAMATSWVDWSSTNDGTLSVGSSVVSVTLSGLADSLVNGDYYYNNGSTGGTSSTGTYGGLTPFDMIQEWNSGQVTISFSEAIINPYIALVSVGQPGTFNVNYAFQNLQNPINVISFGSNYWGYGGYSISGNTFSGHEFNGILQLIGTYSSLTFDISPNEYWHGFNIGTDSTSAPVPEPGTMALLGLGMAGLAVYGKRRNNKA
ncbi:MAG: PEP-CTERM sorting domain-containing protein [Desulfuromonadaceae bacterium]|nr:PEP-CTERM sorting domain-containing protein [Desulfuromonadaceae bacterium]